MDELVRLRAVDQAAMLRRREISAVELLDAHLLQIERVNPQVNAIVTLVPEIARRIAEEADRTLASGDDIPLLTGLPVVHKDTHETKGIRTTFGSPVFQSFVPNRNVLIVERQQRAGAVTLGKTNTPQHGAGSQTFNEVFGVTRNPWNPELTPGGSSGGAAVAVATGMAALADGSDYGASLRNPASFTNTVGLRPSPGRIPSWPSKDVWASHTVHGPIARTVEDIALFMTATAGPDPHIPISIDQPGSVFATPLAGDWTGVPLAWSEDLGELAIDPEVTQALSGARTTLSDIGFVVTDDAPSFRGASEAFTVLRGFVYAREFAEALRRDPDAYKATIRESAEYGLSLTTEQVGAAIETRTRIRNRVVKFLDKHRFLALPTAAVPPFPVSVEYPTEIAGQPMANYTSWFASCYLISLTGLPAISVPAGFTSDGMPVGLQIVGRPKTDVDVLRAAYAFQEATGWWKLAPPPLPAPA